MNIDKATEILKEYIQDDKSLYNLGAYIAYEPGDISVTLDGEFNIDELKAISWWMENIKEIL